MGAVCVARKIQGRNRDSDDTRKSEDGTNLKYALQEEHQRCIAQLLPVVHSRGLQVPTSALRPR